MKRKKTWDEAAEAMAQAAWESAKSAGRSMASFSFMSFLALFALFGAVSAWLLKYALQFDYQVKIFNPGLYRACASWITDGDIMALIYCILFGGLSFVVALGELVNFFGNPDLSKPEPRKRLWSFTACLLTFLVISMVAGWIVLRRC